jgi:hypothetical protein
MEPLWKILDNPFANPQHVRGKSNQISRRGFLGYVGNSIGNVYAMASGTLLENHLIFFLREEEVEYTQNLTLRVASTGRVEMHCLGLGA